MMLEDLMMVEQSILELCGGGGVEVAQQTDKVMSMIRV